VWSGSNILIAEQGSAVIVLDGGVISVERRWGTLPQGYVPPVPRYDIRVTRGGEGIGENRFASMPPQVRA
jgi:hypothetical protein